MVIESGVVEGKTTGMPIALRIENVDARTKDYTEIADISALVMRIIAGGLNMVCAIHVAVVANPRAKRPAGLRQARWRGKYCMNLRL